MKNKPIGSGARLLSAYVTRMKKVNGCVPRTDRKPAFRNERANMPLRFASPESAGIDSDYIMRFYSELENRKSLRMQSVFVARGSTIVSKGVFYPFRSDVRCICHSLSKSITSLAVGFLISEGRLSLDTRLGEIFGDQIRFIGKFTGSKIRIRDLLTMSTGVQFNEINAVTSENWTSQFLTAIQKFRPGTSFEYNSMNSYMLAAVVVRITGMSLCKFLDKRLFGPLGIRSYFWEKGPEGIEKGGWGLYMLPEDILKIGMLILQNGVWNGKRIVSSKWISEATKPQIKTPKITGVYDYGYHMWVDPEHDEVLFNGMFGRNLHIFRKTRTLVLTIGYNSDLFQRSDAYPIIKKYFGKDFLPGSVLPENKEKLKKLREYEKCLVHPTTHISRLVRKTYRTDGIPVMGNCTKIFAPYDDERIGISILPTMCQAIHNNFRPGIKKIMYRFKPDGCQLTVWEDDCMYSFFAGYFESVENVVKIGYDEYRISAYGEMTIDEEDVPVLKLSVSFLELSNQRYIRTYFYSDGIRIKCEEMPGHKFVLNTLKTIVNESSDASIVRKTKRAVESHFFKGRVKHFLHPSVNGIEL